jgi:hypothetical protein
LESNTSAVVNKAEKENKFAKIAKLIINENSKDKLDELNNSSLMKSTMI